MADLGFSFDAESIEPSTGYDLIPPGDYAARIAAADRKSTKAGTGEYIALEFEIVDPVCNGRKIWNNLNLWNQNPKAVEIAKSDFSAICRAVGVLQVRDTSQIVDKILTLTIGSKVRKDTGEAENVIKKYSPQGGGKPVATTGKPSAPAATTEKAPWDV